MVAMRRTHSPQLFVLYRFHILSTGTCRTNRIGWPKDVMSLKKTPSTPRGSYKLAVSRKFGIGAVQWFDSKIVNCISSFLDFKEQTIKRQIGSNKEEFPCPGMMVLYQENMSGVDRVDQMRLHFGGLASVSHFKKWYKKALFAIIDCMLLNGLHLWNASCDKIPGRIKLKRHQYLRIIANRLLRYKTPTYMSPVRPSKKTRTARFESPVVVAPADEGKETVAAQPNHKCLVCSIEASHYRALFEKQQHADAVTVQHTPGAVGLVSEVMKQKVKKGCSGLRRAVACCMKCEVNAPHNTVLDERKKKKIHGYFPPTMSCMDILHSPLGKQIWNIQRDNRGKCIARVRTKHVVITQLHSEIADDLGVADSVIGDRSVHGRK